MVLSIIATVLTGILIIMSAVGIADAVYSCYFLFGHRSDWKSSDCRAAVSSEWRRDLYFEERWFTFPLKWCHEHFILSNNWQCDAGITLSTFSKILTKDTGEIWGVFCEFKFWFMFCLSHCSNIYAAACYIGPRCNGTRLYIQPCFHSDNGRSSLEFPDADRGYHRVHHLHSLCRLELLQSLWKIPTNCGV